MILSVFCMFAYMLCLGNDIPFCDYERHVYNIWLIVSSCVHIGPWKALPKCTAILLLHSEFYCSLLSKHLWLSTDLMSSLSLSCTYNKQSFEKVNNALQISDSISLQIVLLLHVVNELIIEYCQIIREHLKSRAIMLCSSDLLVIQSVWNFRILLRWWWNPHFSWSCLMSS